MRRRPFPVFVSCVAAVMLGGCSSVAGDKPPKPPTAAALAKFVTNARQPAYWLGPDFRGATVSNIRVDGGSTSLSYGEWTCDTGSGCSDSGGVYTGRRATLADLEPAEEADPDDCWTRIGKAVALLDGCVPDGYPQLLMIFSGDLEINVSSIYIRDGQSEVSARGAARRLRPVNARTPWPLQPPKRLSCREFRQIDSRLRRHMPRPLRPMCRP